ncbi:MAG TPA: cupin domain-containing protein [Spirochaetota bacterium]|nr:cupin domain-containing protein [Spirochaetota bacterium]
MENSLIFSKGKLFKGEKGTDIESLPWNPHPSFRGVSMKNIVCGSDTDGRLSCHLVRIDAGCEIGNHMHDGKMELHEVVEGSGVCTVGEDSLPYNAGVMACIPDNINHRVEAGDRGLYILAKFLPALI